MRRGLRALPVLFALAIPAGDAAAAVCADEDFATRVSGTAECLLMRRYGAIEKPAALVVWLHGNVSSGGPANSHFRVAEQAARKLATQNVLVVALVRPGYPDGSGASSSGSDLGRRDNWQGDTIEEIAVVVERLRAHYRPGEVVVVGHSGGAAIAAVLLGMRPKLASAALLIGCPCDVPAWRAGRSGPPWRSEDPMRWIGAIDGAARIIAVTGAADDTTPPDLARRYVEALRARGVDAVFESIADAGHVDILRAPAVAEATGRLLR